MRASICKCATRDALATIMASRPRGDDGGPALWDIDCDRHSGQADVSTASLADVFTTCVCSAGRAYGAKRRPPPPRTPAQLRTRTASYKSQQPLINLFRGCTPSGAILSVRLAEQCLRNFVRTAPFASYTVDCKARPWYDGVKMPHDQLLLRELGSRERACGTRQRLAISCALHLQPLQNRSASHPLAATDLRTTQ